MSTVGAPGLAAGVFSAGWGTLFNTPEEYGTHWEGFGKRYGMRLTGVSTSNAAEALLSGIWGEDPRYVRAAGKPFGVRLGQVFKLTFAARNSHGDLMPAYARLIAVPGTNFASNLWRADSEADVQHALSRTAFGFLGRLGSNAFAEFWPDVSNRLFHRGAAAPPAQPGPTH